MKTYQYHQEDRTPEIDDAANEAGATLEEEKKANILREAAPQLLDALTDLLGAFDKARTMRAPAGHYDEDIYYNGIDLHAQIENAREAIAKANA